MDVTLLYFDCCPNWQEAQTRVRQALRETGAPGSPAVSCQTPAARGYPLMKPRTPRSSPTAGAAGGTAPTSQCPSPPSDTEMNPHGSTAVGVQSFMGALAAEPRSVNCPVLCGGGTWETAVLEDEPDHRDSVLHEEERRTNDCVMICLSRS